jgi:diguanylate cyclase (GGDEF)-like protein/excisionase family DNA binding protein
MDDPKPDTRGEIVRLLVERRNTIIQGCISVFPYNGTESLEPEHCEALGRKLLGLLCAAVECRLDKETHNLSAVQRLVKDRRLPMPRFFSFVHLLEHTVLDELALDRSQAQIIRRSSFDLLAAYCDCAPEEPTSPTITDKLTTLYSRAMMDVVLSIEVQRADRFSFPIAFAVFDVDKLSELNRSHGYGVGDRVLERLSIAIRQFFRQDDWVFRHGEDSIAVLLSHVNAEDALALSSRVVAMVEDRLGFTDHNTNNRIRVTVSGALVTSQGSLSAPSDLESLLLEADSVIHRAKLLGGNRVETATMAPSSLSLQNAARYLQMSPDVIQRLIADGTLKATGSGATTRIPTAVAEDYRNAKATRRPALQP